MLTAVIAATLVLAVHAAIASAGPSGPAPNPVGGATAVETNIEQRSEPDTAEPRSNGQPESSTTGLQRVICIDPGHGGPETGAVNGTLKEKDVNLKIALKLARLLEDEGYKVVLTRDSDRAPSATADGRWAGLTKDLQTRIDIANAADADLFVSIHNNAASSASASGTEVWYSGSRSFGEENKKLAELIQAGMIDEMRAIGYDPKDLGIKDDINFGAWSGRTGNIYVLGPGAGSLQHTPTQMPGVLGESLFISNANDARILKSEEGLDAIARGYRDGIVSYFEQSSR
ncbi:MAG: N-acetylmuramoyl-L-alanine amidase family protein [Chloroflexota bacterium]